MIDTIKGYIDITDRHKSDFQELFKDSIKTIRNNDYSIAFNIENMKVTITFKNEKPCKLWFNGSITKFHYGNNLYNLSWKDFKKAIESLSEKLRVDLSKAILTRVDFGINILMDYPVSEYLDCLQEYPRLNKTRYKDSVSFFTRKNLKVYSFYDKIEEMQIRNNEQKYLAKEFKDYYILRYEVRFKNSLNNIFGLRRKVFRVNRLYRERNQIKLVERWYKGYLRITKYDFGIDPEHLLKTRNGVIKYLSYYGLFSLGYDRINSKIARLEFDVKNSSVKRSRMRKVLRDIQKYGEDSSLDKGILNELNQKIYDTKNYILENKSVPYFILEND